MVPPTTKWQKAIPKSAYDEEHAARGSVDKNPHDTGEDDEDGILDARCNHGNIASQTRHLSDISEILDNDVRSSQLLFKEQNESANFIFFLRDVHLSRLTCQA
jgi:hypothetical protein